jgi:glutathione S-transferase
MRAVGPRARSCVAVAISPTQPHMVSVGVSPYCELARWTMDRRGVAYTEEFHAPFLHRLATGRHRGGGVVPVLNLGERSLTDARQIVEHYETVAPPELRLFADDPALGGEARALFDEFFDVFGVAVRAWAYAYLLPERRSTSKAWIDGAPRLERLIVPPVYPLLAAIVKRSLKLGPNAVAEQRAIMQRTLTSVGERLADGRRYLVGDSLTGADLAFVVLVAPAVLPPEYIGPLPTLDELPVPMRREVEQIRTLPAGEFALRVYREERALRPGAAAAG